MVKITTEQQVRLHAAFLTAAGSPAPIEGTPEWSAAPAGVVNLIVDPDGRAALCQSVAAGTAQVSVSADADLGTGVRTITGTIGIEVSEASAEAVEITADTPEFKTVTLTVTVEMLPDGTAKVTGHGNPDTLYHVEAADDVAGPYAEIGTTLSDSTGVAIFIDPDAASHTTRFYRLRWP
jgi:hypothetical protein